VSRKALATNGSAITASTKMANLLFATLAVATLLIFSPVIRALAQASFRSDVYSYIPLIPLITLFLIFDARQRIFLDSKPDLRFGFVFVGLAILMLYTSGRWNGLSGSDRISWQTASLICVWIAVFGLCNGKKALNKALFPLLFLSFMVPLPNGVLRRDRILAERLGIIFGSHLSFIGSSHCAERNDVIYSGIGS